MTNVSATFWVLCVNHQYIGAQNRSERKMWQTLQFFTLNMSAKSEKYFVGRNPDLLDWQINMQRYDTILQAVLK